MLLSAVCLLTLLGLIACAEPGTVNEYEVKAAFVFNFTQFVEWPEAAFPDAASPVCIGILGDDPFGPILDQVVQGETVKGRKLVLKRSKRVEDLKNCQVVFIARSEKARLSQILSGLQGTGALTVSEIEGCAERGCIINFFLQANKLRFEINPEAARSKGLKLSAQLLSLARIAGPGAVKGTP